jgi:uncharacterized membrane protein
MMKRKNEAKLAATAVLLAIGIAGTATAVQAGGAKEKCYGISKAGKNDCANGNHSCAGQAKADYAATEWLYVPTGDCTKEGGKTTPPASK